MAGEQPFDYQVKQAFQFANEEFDIAINNLISMLSHLPTDEDTKMDYVLSYMALAYGSDDVFPSKKSKDDYSNTNMAYQNRIGVNEYNVYRYTTRLFFAVHTNQGGDIKEIYEKKPDLSYMDQFPGVLKDLVKRATLNDSTVRMDEVAVSYPKTLLNVLRNQLNSKDLAVLAMNDDIKILPYRDAINSHFVNACRSMNGEDGTYKNITFSAYPDLSIMLLVNEICKKETPQKFSMYFEDAQEFVYFLAKVKLNNISLVSCLVKYITTQESLPTKDGQIRYTMVPFIDTEGVMINIPNGKSGNPLSLTVKDANGNLFVQLFKWYLANALTYKPTNE